MSSTFEQDENGLCIIRCDPPVNGSDSFVFRPEVIASWKALLGLASTREAVAAIMQGKEDTSRYDHATGRGVWTGAFEAFESALTDSATGVSMMSDDGEVLNDPLTAARNRTREGMNLPVMSNETDARMCAALTADGSGVEASSGIDVACTRDMTDWTPSLMTSPAKTCWTNARNASTNRSCQDKTNRIKEIDYGR